MVYNVTDVSPLRSPELELGLTSAYRSKYQSFRENGFPATFGYVGPVTDPIYQNTGDINEHKCFDFNQLRSVAKVRLATPLRVAGYK